MTAGPHRGARRLWPWCIVGVEVYPGARRIAALQGSVDVGPSICH